MKNWLSKTTIKLLLLCIASFFVFLAASPVAAIPMTQATPTNDDLADAITIGSVPYTNSSIRNRFATMETNEVTPTCGGTQSQSVWWVYTPVTDGILNVNTDGSNYDTALSIWTGTGHPLTEEACNDDIDTGAGYYLSSIIMPLTGGTTYYIRVAGWNSAVGRINLNVNFSTNRPPNDDLVNAFIINTVPYTNNSINNEFATLETNEATPTCGGTQTQSVWWAYTPNGNGILNVDTTGSNYDTALSIWTGIGHPLTEEDCNYESRGNLQSSITLPVNGETTYYIRVAGLNVAFGDIILNVNFVPATFVWDGGGINANWSTPENWVSDTVPGAADTVQFNGTSTTPSIVDAGFVGGSVANVIIDNTYTGTLTIENPLAVNNNYFQDGGTVVVNPLISFTVDGIFSHTNGILRETRLVGSNSSASFLHIQTSGGAVAYRGVDLTTTASDLGSTTVSIRVVDSATGEYCTTTGASSPSYAARCYNIAPTTDGATTLRLWALTSELNGVTEGNLAVYRNNPSGSDTWVELTTNATTGNDGGNYSYAEADTPGFSDFLLGDTNNTPTAVTLKSFSVSDQPTGIVTLIVGFLMLTVGFLEVRKH